MKKTSIAIGLGISALTGILLQAAPATAATLFSAGNLANPNAKAQVSFFADGTSTVTIQSYSWGGGNNTAGTRIAAGGFDLNLTLFNEAGNYFDERDDIAQNNLDFRYTGVLARGNYTAVVAAFGNSSQGFGTINTPFLGTGDFGGRTSAYAFDIINVNNTATAVPEPFTIVGTLIGGATALRMRKRLKATNKL
jgi:hypothetical protein